MSDNKKISDNKTYKEIIEAGNIKDGRNLLERATKYRDFEITISWERAKYFTLFLSAIVVAYCTTKEENNQHPQWISLLLAGLGFLISYIWYLVNRGSKLIYENWEHHIDFIEKEYSIGTISRIHCFKPYHFYKPISTYPISPSKAVIAVSLLITAAFAFVFFYEIGHLYYIYCICCICCNNYIFILFLSLFLALFIVSLLLLHSNISSGSYKQSAADKNTIYLYDRIKPQNYQINLTSKDC
jgi:hypothetical protein